MNKIKKLLVFLYEKYFEFKRIHLLRSKFKLNVLSPKKTITYIKKNKCSIARYGDGEFDLIFSARDLHFQNKSDVIKAKLENVLNNKNKNLLICIPRCFYNTKDCNEHSKTFWLDWGKIDNHQQKIVEMIWSHTGKKYIFGDSQITRPYIDWKNSKRAKKTFPLLKSLWAGKDIIIAEGEQTRLGVGNDLFDDAKSIKRILAPAIGAFEVYDDIKQAILDTYSGELIIMALGPTATILASDFADMNIQALDIGNIDIEYEWYLMKAKERVSIPGKFTNEANDGRVFTQCSDAKYLNQIIKKI